MGKSTATATRTEIAGGARPDHFSTYVPREVVRRLKVVATIRDVPLWAVVTTALQSYLEVFQKEHGRLPALDEPAERRRE
ncbi:MAG: hypothetical protein MUC56_07490 [Thermoanaerobaculales bacterium]|jgi:predicted cobalt transporter CbtA|nr:hypothetical protein [Thermoanaerobaculales bacterium]